MSNIMLNRSSIVKRNLNPSTYPLKHVLYSSKRRLLLSHWGYGVTVCIAAITAETRLLPYEHIIVTASDTKVSFGSHSAENTIKAESLHESWGVMFAGNDITNAVPVMDGAREILKGKDGTFREAKNAVKMAYQEHLRELISDTFLSPYKMTFEEFKKKGQKQLPGHIYNSVCEQIREFDLGCTFLVYGFDEVKRPHLFVADNPGRISVYDKPGFCAIGSGQMNALSMLSYMGQATEKTSLPETIYNVLTAKYMAEGADGVGKETFFFLKVCQAEAMIAYLHIEPHIRAIWESEGRPKLPSEMPRVRELVTSANFRFLLKDGKEKTVRC
jgi:20S proteasome alpha/beta subunit